MAELYQRGNKSIYFLPFATGKNNDIEELSLHAL